MRRGGYAEHRRLVLRTGASRWAPPAEPSMYMNAALVPGMFHVKPRRFAEESLSSGFGRRTSRQYMREFILACDDGMLRCPPGEVPLALRAPNTARGSHTRSDAKNRSRSCS